MKIESYKKKRGNLYEITLDDGKSYELYDDIILNYELLIDKKLDKKKLNEVLEENSLLDAYYKSLKYLSVKMRTETEIRKYLKKYDFSNYAIGYSITRLRSEGYLDQDRYAQAYINDAINLTLSGPKKIETNLIKLGIERNVIVKYLSKIDDSIWMGRIEKILAKKAKINKNGETLFKNKMYNELIVNGYSSELIKSSLSEFILDDREVFKKEADAMLRKLSIKYSGVDLNSRFRNKMYMKGFSIDKINEYLNSMDE